MGNYTIQYADGCDNFGLLRGEEAFGPYPVRDDDIALLNLEDKTVLVALKEHDGPLDSDTVYELAKQGTEVEQGIEFEDSEDSEDGEGEREDQEETGEG